MLGKRKIEDGNSTKANYNSSHHGEQHASKRGKFKDEVKSRSLSPEIKKEPIKKSSDSLKDQIESATLALGHEDRRCSLDSTEYAIQSEAGNFSKFRISEKTQVALKKTGVNYLFPVQISTFDHIYDAEDVIVRDLTGSGKTLGFALPTVERLRDYNLLNRSKSPLVLCILPTRELVIQVCGVFDSLSHKEDELRTVTIYGGVDYARQESAFFKGVDVVVGTTGRLLDHLNKGNFSLKNLRACILDEADRMLEMGFQEDVEKIFEFVRKEKANLPESDKIQVMLFSATMPQWVHEASKSMMTKPLVIDLAKDLKNKTAKRVKHMSISCPWQNRTSIISDLILCYGGAHGKTIVFCQTKADANELFAYEKIKDKEVLHGDVPQKQREITFKGFKDGRFHTLVATDVASRGLDIPKVDLIIQCEPPKDAETYIHRSGRTGRVGRKGLVITFYTKKQYGLVQRIQHHAGITMKSIGAPQPEQLIRASTRDIMKGLSQITTSALPLFADAAKELIESMGPEKALSLALAKIAGATTDIKNRSMLTGNEGFVTYELQLDKEAHSLSYVWNILRNSYPEHLHREIRNMRMYKDSTGVAFDVPDPLCGELDDIYAQHLRKERYICYQLRVAKELPQLKEDSFMGGQIPHNNFRGGHAGHNMRPGGYGRGNHSHPPPFGGNRPTNNNPRHFPSNSGGMGRGGFSGPPASFGFGGAGGGSAAWRQPREEAPRNSPPARRGEPAHEGHRPRYGEQGKGEPPSQSNLKCLFLGGLETKEDVEAFLNQNKVRWEKINYLYDREGRSKMAAFVDLVDPEWEKALTLNGSRFMNRYIKINPSQDKPAYRKQHRNIKYPQP